MSEVYDLPQHVLDQNPHYSKIVLLKLREQELLEDLQHVRRLLDLARHLSTAWLHFQTAKYAVRLINEEEE